jgi:YodL-like
MRYKIWQIALNKVEPARLPDILFAGLNEGALPDPSHYSKVYEGDINQTNLQHALDQLFYKFNTNHPIGYQGRSMSVSDVVSFDGTHAFYCNPVGWLDLKTCEGFV